MQVAPALTHSDGQRNGVSSFFAATGAALLAKNELTPFNSVEQVGRTLIG
jgi:hypothetical protein